MSIYITGDIHGNPQRLSNANFPAGKQLTKEDYVIILGDMGIIIWIKILMIKKFVYMSK